MLNEFENCIAVSGREDEMRSLLQKKLASLCDYTEIDGMGNLHAVNQGIGPAFTIVTYMDEPGVILTQITEDGYLRFETIGRINPAFLVSKRVYLGDCIGIISLKAIHMTTKQEREIPVKTSQLFIDIGAKTKEEAENLVTIGDYGALDIPFLELKNECIKGRALAGRMGCYAAIEVLKKNTGHNIRVIFAVQREIKSRGLSCCEHISADYTFVFDGISAKTYVEQKMDGPELGKGIVLLTKHSTGMTDPKIIELCKKAQMEKDVLLQLNSVKDHDVLATLSKTGQHNAIPLSIPVRYETSAAPVASQNDLFEMIRLTNFLINKCSKEGEV